MQRNRAHDRRSRHAIVGSLGGGHARDAVELDLLVEIGPAEMDGIGIAEADLEATRSRNRFLYLVAGLVAAGSRLAEQT